jgi:hypothetical protein
MRVFQTSKGMPRVAASAHWMSGPRKRSTDGIFGASLFGRGGALVGVVPRRLGLLLFGNLFFGVTFLAIF